MTIKIIAIAVILLLQISPSTLLSNDKADSLSKAKARGDSKIFDNVGRDSAKYKSLLKRISGIFNDNYYTNEFREQMRYYEIRNNLLKNITTRKILDLFEDSDSSLKKRENFQAYFREMINMGDTLKLNEYELDTCLKVHNSLVYKYRISNYEEMFRNYDWKNTAIVNGKIYKYTYYGGTTDIRSPEGFIAIDTTEDNLNKIVFISGNWTLSDNYFDYCQCEPDTNTFVDYLYYKYHAFNDRYDNIHKVGKATYKMNSTYTYYDIAKECYETASWYVKFVLKDNKWVDVDVNYMEDIE